ncbi:hypothetical protein OSTOST_19210 [Ostertagia ostertagi]
MLMSMTFVFCSLLELAIVGYKVKNEEILKKRGYVPKKTANHHVNMFESSPAGLCRYEKRLTMFESARLDYVGTRNDLCCRWNEVASVGPCFVAFERYAIGHRRKSITYQLLCFLPALLFSIYFTGLSTTTRSYDKLLI